MWERRRRQRLEFYRRECIYLIISKNSNELGLGGRQRGGRDVDEDVEYYGIQLVYLVELFESFFFK